MGHSPDSSAVEAADVSSAEVAKYSAALQLMQYQLQVLWAIFGIFLLAETVLLSAVAQVFTQGHQELVLAGAVVGLLLVFPWWATFQYARYFYLLRIQQAKELEPKIARYLTEGHDLAEGKPVRGVKLPWLVRTMRPQHAGWFLMTLFALAFAGIAWLSGCVTAHGAGG